ncbi:MAG TPA: pilus assembly protein TadG-related protein, partial [Oligoflexia bacterium]|nr:pilus assembly protein TadG-related protein [Oligoflexia bacterium]
MNKSFFRITLRKQATGRSSEKGVYLLIVAGGIVGLLTIVGLVIDVANIFRARLVLQSATDAAAIAGLAYIATYDTSSDTYVDTGKAIAREILCRNLAGRNITVGRSGTPCRSSSDITMTYTNNRIDNPSLSVSANGDVSLYLMHLVSGALSQNLIVAQATSEINRAHVSLMLDTSDSMQCDANLTNTPHCGCTGPGNTCASTDTKLHYLQQAVQNFLDY